jgi:hypothetical protein
MLRQSMPGLAPPWMALPTGREFKAMDMGILPGHTRLDGNGINP